MAEVLDDRTDETAQAPVSRLSLAGDVTVHHVARRSRNLRDSLAAAVAGYDEVNMSEVAQRAGVAVGTLYRNFPSVVNCRGHNTAGSLE
jgi:hypothetical protein